MGWLKKILEWIGFVKGKRSQWIAGFATILASARMFFTLIVPTPQIVALIDEIIKLLAPIMGTGFALTMAGKVQRNNALVAENTQVIALKK